MWHPLPGIAYEYRTIFAFESWLFVESGMNMSMGIEQTVVVRALHIALSTVLAMYLVVCLPCGVGDVLHLHPEIPHFCLRTCFNASADHHRV